MGSLILMNVLAKYKIASTFNNPKEISDWIDSLNKKEISNLLSLDINENDIPFPPYVLINKNLLNTNDYNEKVKAIAKLKNAEGWYHLYEYMLTDEFLNSPSFYEDLELASKAPSAQHPLWILGDPIFIHSPYHKRDLERIVYVKDNNPRNDYDLRFVVSECLTEAARSIDSIKSPYHEHDMDMMEKAGSTNLQTFHSYPEGTISHLAVNKVSLSRKDHIHQMELLLENPEIDEQLYAVLTDKNFSESKNYYRVIDEMINNKNNFDYILSLCIYAIGSEKAIRTLFVGDQLKYECEYYRLSLDERENIEKQIEDNINIVTSTCREIEEIPERKSIKERLFKRKIRNKNKKD